VGDRVALKDVKALGLVLLEEGEASGYLTIFTVTNVVRKLVGAEPGERGGVPQVLERHLGGPPGLMKIFKLR